MSLFTVCNTCFKKFPSSRALDKHGIAKHGKELSQESFFFYDEQNRVPLPTRRHMSVDDQEPYLEWLACVTERVNNTHHPKYEARWVRIAIMQTPEVFARHVLWKLNSPVHSVRKMSHLKQPIMVTSSMRYNFKIFDDEVFKSLFEEQKQINLVMNAAFSSSGASITEDPYEDDDPMQAIKAAKERGLLPRSKRTTPKVRSSITIEEGEGSRTREFEVQWRPKLYRGADGKLTLRFYVNKLQL